MIRLNLLPKTLRKRVEPGWWRLTAIIFPLIVFVLVAMVHLGDMTRISKLENERGSLQTEVATLQPFIKKQRELSRRKTELEQIINVDKEIKKRFVSWSDNLASFINQIPRKNGRFEVFLRSVNTKLVPSDTREGMVNQGLYDRKPMSVEFTVQGEAKNDAALVRFVKAFEDSPNFGIDFKQGTLNEDGGYDFSASVGITEQAEKAEGGEQGAR